MPDEAEGDEDDGAEEVEEPEEGVVDGGGGGEEVVPHGEVQGAGGPGLSTELIGRPR